MASQKPVVETIETMTKSIISGWQQLTKAACTNPNLVLPGFGTQLEVWNCIEKKFQAVSQGQDIDLPKRKLSLIETTGAVPENFKAADGYVYAEYQPGVKVNLESVTYTAHLTLNNYNVWMPYFGKLTTYRLVACDPSQTYWAFNAIMYEDQVKFPSGTDASAMYEATLQPSGFFVFGNLSGN